MYIYNTLISAKYNSLVKYMGEVGCDLGEGSEKNWVFMGRLCQMLK